MQATISTTLDANAEAVWGKVKCSATLSYVTKGLLGFKGFAEFPAVWQEGQTVHTRLLLFGLIPGWKHQLTFKKVSDLEMQLSTSEAGGLISRWNHDIEVRKLSSEQCRYVDRIDIEAGWATPLCACFLSIPAVALASTGKRYAVSRVTLEELLP